jgi:hypothetical protein
MLRNIRQLRQLATIPHGVRVQKGRIHARQLQHAGLTPNFVQLSNKLRPLLVVPRLEALERGDNGKRAAVASQRFRQAFVGLVS